jgi:hypothetical protein
MSREMMSIGLLRAAKSLMALLVLMLPIQAWAVAIPVANGTFDYTSGAGVTNPNNTWTTGLGAAVALNPSGTADTGLGWENDPLQGSGKVGMIVYPSVFTTAPTGGTGYVNVKAGDALHADSGFMRQEITGALDPNTAYTLTVDLFERSTTALPEKIWIQLLTESGGAYTALGTFDDTTLVWASGVATATLTVNTDATVAAGSDFYIRLGAQTASTSLQQINFDNVTLVAEALSVPEPATLGLMGIGLAAIGFAKRRKRTA